MSTITQDSFTRVNNDTNGNPRYVIHFLDLSCDADVTSEHVSRITQKYDAALRRSRVQGGRKFHNKQFGGVLCSIRIICKRCATA